MVIIAPICMRSVTNYSYPWPDRILLSDGLCSSFINTSIRGSHHYSNPSSRLYITACEPLSERHRRRRSVQDKADAQTHYFLRKRGTIIQIMADPISIVGLITGVVELADMVFVRTFLYVKAVKERDKDRLALNSEIGALFGILSRLQLLSRTMEGGEEGEEGEEDEGCKPVLQAVHLDNCFKTLLTIKSKLDAHEGHGHALKTALKPLRWPFTSSEVGNLLMEVERHRKNLSLALAADGLSALLRALSTQGEIRETVHGIESELNRVALNDQRRQILDSFGSTDPGKNHDMSRKLWRPNTGLWLTKGTEFQGWLTNKTAKNIWCYGIPGAGKTVLASAVIEEVLKCRSPSVAAAYFYCDYKDAKTQDPANILGSLAKQLIRQSERCFKESEAFYEVHHSGKQVSTSYRPDELRDLILQMSSFFNQTMIVVDGLDECGKDTATVVELLSSLSKSEKSSVQTVFLSRDEIEIRETLTDYNPLSIAADKGDLQLYVASEIGARMKNRRLHINNKSIGEHIMDRLVNGANGM